MVARKDTSVYAENQKCYAMTAQGRAIVAAPAVCSGHPVFVPDMIGCFFGTNADFFF